MSKKDLVKLGLFGSILGHIGDGNFHETILFEEKQRNEVEKCVDKMVYRALEMEGTCTVRIPLNMRDSASGTNIARASMVSA